MVNKPNLASYVRLFLLVLIILAVYWRVLNFDFVGFDEDVYITQNDHVKRGLTFEGVTWAFTTTEACFWHPLVWLSYMLEHTLFGEKPFIYHLTNLLLHIANTLLLFAVLNRMTSSAWKSWFVAALFAVHPLHVESVAWVAQRKDVLCTLFLMLTLWAYVRYASSPRIGTYILVVVFFAMGLMAKPMLVTLPLVLLLIDYWPIGRTVPSSHSLINRVSVKGLLAEKIPLLILSFGTGAGALIAQKGGRALASLEAIPLGIRLSNSLVACVGYLAKTVWPRRLAVFYPHPGDSVPEWQVVGAALLIVAITFLVLAIGKRKPFLPVGWFWYLITIAPVIGLVQVGSHAMADRYTYIPLIGIFMIIAWLAPSMGEYMGREEKFSISRFSESMIFTIAAALVIAALMVSTWVQVGYWQNGQTLFSHAIKVTSNNWLAHHNLGVALKEKGRIEEAVAHFRKALEIRPNYPDARLNLATTLAEKGDLDSAGTEFARALRGTADDADVYYNLGIAFCSRGRLEEAEAEFRKALAIKPDHVLALMNLGSVLGQKGDNQNAIKYLTRAIEIRPSYAEAHFNLAVAFFIAGEYERAWEELCLAEKHGFKPDHKFRKFLAIKAGKE